MTTHNQGDALLPCPFCGANEEGFRLGKTGKPLVEELSEGGWRVTCYTCCYSIAQERVGNRNKFPTAGAAIAAWNTRLEALQSTGMREALVEARYAIRKMLAAQIDIETREDLKGDLQMQMRAAKQDCEDAEYLIDAALASIPADEPTEAMP